LTRTGELARFLVGTVESPLRESDNGFPEDGVYLITDDEGGIARELAEAIRGHGGRAALVAMGDGSEPENGEYRADLTGSTAVTELLAHIRRQDGRVCGLIHLLPLEAAPPVEDMDVPAWHDRLAREVKSLFNLAQAAHDDLKLFDDPLVLTASALGGDFGLGCSASSFPGQGGLAGLIKVLALEWPDVRSRRESFDRVFDTKADGAFALVQRLRPESLRFLVFFSSVAGLFGNRGQGDYAAANEVLNKLALSLDTQWEGRVVSINWGPWATAGMASPEVQRQFRERGVEVIAPDLGGKAFLDELERGRKGEVIVVLGQGPWKEVAVQPAVRNLSLPLIHSATTTVGSEGGIELTRTLDLEHDLYLDDHHLDGRPVFPAAMAMELMAEAALQTSPDLKVVELRDFRLLRGLVLETGPLPVRVVARVQPRGSAGTGRVAVDCEIRDAQASGPPFYSAVVELAEEAPPAIDRAPYVIQVRKLHDVDDDGNQDHKQHPAEGPPPETRLLHHQANHHREVRGRSCDTKNCAPRRSNCGGSQSRSETIQIAHLPLSRSRLGAENRV